jgi:hypothetical protein
MPFQEQLNLIIQSPYILIGIPVGLLCGIFGYRIFKLVLFVSGFCFGVLLTLSVTQAMQLQSGVIVVSIIAGILFGLISFFLYQLGIFFIGAFMGGTLGSMLGSAGLGSGQVILYIIVIGALAGGVLALILQKFLIVFATSFVGAVFFTLGALAYLIKGISVFHIISIAVLTTCFMLIQYVTKKKPNPPEQQNQRA